MARRKKQNNLVIFLLLGIAIYFIAQNGNFFATVVIDEGTSPSPYVCPTGESITCNVRGIMGCSQSEGENVVYCGSDRTISWSTIEQCENDGASRSTIGCPAQNCNFVSQNAISCNGEFRVEQSLSNPTVVISEPLSYTSTNSAGNDPSSQYNIQPGQVAKVTGGDSNTIVFEVLQITQECTQDICTEDGTGILECNNGVLASTPTFCSVAQGEVCSATTTGAQCIDLVGLSSQRLLSDTGEELDGVGRGQNINFEFRLFSNTLTQGSTTVKLMDIQNNVLQTETLQTQYSGQTYNVAFTPIDTTGSYKIMVSTTHSQGQNDFVPLEFRIANAISMDIQGTSQDATSTIYTNAPAIIRLRVFDGGEELAPADTMISARLITGNNQQPLSIPNRITESPGVYRYELNLPFVETDSILQVDATAQRLGFNLQKTEEFIVQPADVRVTFTNVELLVNIAPGTYTIEFETRDPQGNLISVDSNIARALIPTGQTQQISQITGSNGRYQFDYTFVETGGYFFTIESQKSGFIPEDKRSPAIDVDSSGGGTLECSDNSMCSYGEVCNNGQCVPEDNTSSILLIGLAIFGTIAVVVLVIIIIRLRRKR